MNHRSYARSDRPDDDDNDVHDNKHRLNHKRSERSRSPPAHRLSYGITSESNRKKKTSSSHRYAASPSSSSSSSTTARSNGFIPDEETKKFYEKPSEKDTGFWTTEDYTFRDMLAKDVREEIEDDIASHGSDEESEEDPELAEYADRADMDDDDDEDQKKTIVERLIPMKNMDEKKSNDSKTLEIKSNTKASSSSSSLASRSVV